MFDLSSLINNLLARDLDLALLKLVNYHELELLRLLLGDVPVLILVSLLDLLYLIVQGVILTDYVCQIFEHLGVFLTFVNQSVA